VRKLEWFMSVRLLIELRLIRDTIDMWVCSLGCKSDVLTLNVLKTRTCTLNQLSYLWILLAR